MSDYTVSHVEFHVGDARQAAYYYRTAFGFETLAEGGPETGLADRRSILLGQGDIRLLMTSDLTADGPVARYVARHGDGVANIALRTGDAEGVFRRAVEWGAEVVAEPAEVQYEDGSVAVSAAVRAFGDTVHTFVQYADAGRQLPHPRLRWTDADAEAGAQIAGGEAQLHSLDHFAVCLPAGELAKTVAFYEKGLGFDEAFEEFIEVGDQAMESKVVRSPSGAVTLTFLEPDVRRKPGQIDTFLDAHGGAGVQHLAFGTSDIAAAVPHIAAQGVEFLHTPATYYDAVEGRVGSLGGDLEVLRDLCVLADRDDWGLLYQIFTRSPHARGTFFLELIERRGAQTFGSGNIKGLYEAVERAQALTGAQ
ncbi:4-hydroxyphenylpyruvate dioxygenase [Streptomyces nigrescens]|uniref:4-hydroxyphenylpyruvate dioxygenase n=2 Tax=Streptomyces TaxID=1883 RepID=A0ABN6R528_STRNI|nr:4-hydroxyphenylpyruvate dioxygenase [Streptomyces nigrescens]MEE4421949.1 4-hydroxyphenylpyruvate dioxygenase [Streptomyces sp. DSM 41528]BDM71678.1 4-hydroxyphenylpyruvate dioxygenase [Streptomyces nigrescens]